MTNPLIQKAIEICGGTQSALASQIGSTQQHVSLLLKGATITAEKAVAIDRATAGEIPREKLRPDIFAEPEKRAS